MTYIFNITFSEQDPCLEATLTGVVAHWRSLERASEQEYASDDVVWCPLAHCFYFTWDGDSPVSPIDN